MCRKIKIRHASLKFEKKVYRPLNIFLADTAIIAPTVDELKHSLQSADDVTVYRTTVHLTMQVFIIKPSFCCSKSNLLTYEDNCGKL